MHDPDGNIVGMLEKNEKIYLKNKNKTRFSVAVHLAQ